jgi:hypothetical protein
MLPSDYNATAQPIAELGATLDFTPDLENRKKHSYKKHDIFCIRTPFLSNLGILKSLEKVIQLYAEKNLELLRGKIPNVEKCETFQSEKPVKPLNSKMHLDSVFDELGLL